MRTPTVVLAALGAACLALSLTACSSGADTSTSAADTPVSAADSPSSQDYTPADPPAGYKLVTSEPTGLTFAVPEDWLALQLPQEGVDDSAEVEQFLAATGLTKEDLDQRVDNTELTLTSTVPDEQGLLANINVTRFPFSIEAMDTQEEIEANSAALGTVGDYEEVPTGEGTGRISYYETAVETVVVYGALVVLPMGDGQGHLVVVSASSHEQVTELAQTLAATARY